MYNPHNWVSEEIITAEKLNHIETGVQDTEKEIESTSTIAKEVNAKQDKIGYTPADDSKVVHTSDMRKPASAVAGIEEVSTLQTQVDNSAVGINLALGTSNQVVQASAWNLQVADIKYDNSLGGNLCASVMINNVGHASDLKQGSAYICLTTYDSSGNVLETVNGNNVNYNANGLSQCSISINEGTADIKAYIMTASMNGNTFYSCLKIEKGSKATDWCPNLEEILAKGDKSYTGEVNVKWFGAKGDGVTDDTSSIQRAIDTGFSVLLPPGKYNVTELTGFSAGQIIQGVSKAESWGAQEPKNITLLNGIGSEDNYVIKNRVGGDGIITAIIVRNLSIEGSKKTNGILVGASSSIINVRVSNCKTGFASVKASTIENCNITGCENGFYDITDSRFTNNFIYLNDVGINLTYSNDNIINNNKIEWNGIGISIDRAGCDLISSNIFDRSTTYGIYTNNAYQLTITGNIFKRNLTNHLYLQGTTFNISANSFLKTNSEDNKPGVLAPDVAIFANSVQSSMITNNFVDGKMFDKTGSNDASSFSVSANTIDGINPDNIMVNIPETTVVHGQDTKIIIPLPSYFDGALKDPHNVEILSQRISLTTEGGNFY